MIFFFSLSDEATHFFVFLDIKTWKGKQIFTDYAENSFFSPQQSQSASEADSNPFTMDTRLTVT